MIANIISRYTYTLTDTLKTSGHSFSFNADYDGKSQIVFSRKPKAEEDDFILIMDGKDIAFQGIISKIENASKSDSYKVTAVEMQTLFNQKVILSDEDIKTTTGIEDFIADQITKNFISSDDALLNIDYLTVTANTHTPIAAAVQAENGIYNLRSYISNAMTMYGVFVDFEFKPDALNVVVEKKEQPEFKIDATLPEVQNLTEVIDYQALAKLTVLWRSGQRQFFLKTDGTITEDMNDPDRAKGSSDIIVSQAETEAAMIQEAHDKFTSNSYNHKVTFDVSPDSKMIPSKQVIEVEEEGGSLLPNGYRQLTYIESTGTQHIDTGFKPNQDTRIETDMAVTSGGTSFLFGARNNSSANATSNSFSMPQISGTSLRSDYGSVESGISVSPVQRLKIDKNKNVTSVNDATVTATAQTFSCSYNLVLLAVNTAGTISAKTSAKLYSFKIYDNDDLVHDYIPCRNPSGDVGLYDLVTAQFFGNAGTGVFIQGEAVVNLPEGYERAHYIESTGTQWIDTGVKPNNNTRLVVDLQITASSFSKLQYFYGANFSNGSSSYFGGGYVSNTVLEAWFGSVRNITIDSATKRRTIDHNKTSYRTSDGYSASLTASTFQGANPMYLFSMNTSGSTIYPDATAVAKLYSCQIYDNGIVVRDYIPCKDGTGAFGLFDLVEGKFYGNAGTGSFFGTVKRKLPEGYTQVDYIQSSGGQYINTKYNPKYNTQIVMDISGLGTTQQWLFGSRNSSGSTSSQQFCLYRSSSTAIRADYFGTNASATISDTSARSTVERNANVVNAFGLTITNTAVSVGEVSYPLYLFTLNNAGTAHANGASMKMYSCQIYDNGALVRDFVPCVNTQGTAGLYDLTNNVFYTNAGSGLFTTGEEVAFAEVESGGGVVVLRTANALYVGRNCTIKTKNGIRTSIITAMELSSDSSMVSLIFGNLKVTLIEKLKGVEARK